MYLRKTGNAKAAKGSMTAGQLVATRAGRTRRAAAAAAAAAVPIVGQDHLLAGPLPQDGAPVGVGARRKVPRKQATRATPATEVLPQPDVSQAVLDALANLQGNTDNILKRVQVLEEQTSRPIDSAHSSTLSSVPVPEGFQNFHNDAAAAGNRAEGMYRALEQAEAASATWAGNTESKKYKSGQFRVGGEIPCRKFIPWPHDLCFVGTECRCVTYDELSPLQWICRFIRTILKTQSDCHINMLKYASDLFQNALDLGWATAKGSYKVLMPEMEASDLYWDDLPRVQSIRQQYAQRNVWPAAPQGPGFQKSNNVFKKVCTAYQTGTCPSETDHRQGNTYFRHICAYCFANLNRPFPHREQECRKKRL